MTKDLLDYATDYAFTLLAAVGGSIELLPEPMRTVVVVITAQGIIDNGGLGYFFESDFPENPPYSLFIEAFRRIGADEVSKCIELSADMFPFPHPHLHEAQRQQWINSTKDTEAHAFVLLSNKACGHEIVYKKLAEFVDRNRHAFGAVSTAN